MTKSSLTNYTRLSPNGYFPRSQKVSKITVHHVAGNLTVEQIGSVFSSSARQASSNYGIGTDGRVGCYVLEENGAWTSASYWNDNRAITIEVANTTAGTRDGSWAVGPYAWGKLVQLCADICKRYGFRAVYDGTPNGTFTEHRMFAPTGCPGPFIHSRMQKLCDEVNAILDGDDIEMTIGNEIYKFLTDTHDASGRGKESNMRDRLAWVAKKQEDEIQARKIQDQKIDAINKKVDLILAKLNSK